MRRSTSVAPASILGALLLSLLISGCGARPAPITGQPASTQQPAPTVAPIFSQLPRPGLVETPVPIVNPTTPLPSSPRTEAQLADYLTEQEIFGDTLHSDWTLEHSSNLQYDLTSSAYRHGGSAAVKVTPLYPSSELMFTVSPEAFGYERSRVVAVSFWLSGGSNYIDTDDLSVSVVGSNTYTYWRDNDTSVIRSELVSNPDSPVFPETRLYYLDINRSIPPENWVEVTLWLDKLVYDPEYMYVTGVRIKTARTFFDTYYVDDVRVLLEPE